MLSTCTDLLRSRCCVPVPLTYGHRVSLFHIQGGLSHGAEPADHFQRSAHPVGLRGEAALPVSPGQVPCLCCRLSLCVSDAAWKAEVILQPSMARPVLALQRYRYKGCPRLATASLDSRCGRAARHNQRGSLGLEREGELTAQQNTTNVQLAGTHLLLVKIKCRPLIINQFICKIGIIAGWGRGNTLFLKNKYLT